LAHKTVRRQATPASGPPSCLACPVCVPPRSGEHANAKAERPRARRLDQDQPTERASRRLLHNALRLWNIMRNAKHAKSGDGFGVLGGGGSACLSWRLPSIHCPVAGPRAPAFLGLFCFSRWFATSWQTDGSGSSLTSRIASQGRAVAAGYMLVANYYSDSCPVLVLVLVLVLV